MYSPIRPRLPACPRGPDLATTTVEPHEFLGFLSGKLARRFIDGPETLDLRLSERT
jgi:hypothetical protein